MIDIVMRGMCEGCEYADLVLDAVVSTTTAGNGIIPERKAWSIRCEHLMACLAMKKKMNGQIPEKVPKEKPKGKSYTADEFCDKLKDFINQEHEKQGEAE